MNALLGWGFRDWEPEVVEPSGARAVAVLDALAEGPATSTEIALDIGAPMRNCSAVLSELYKAGVLDRRKWSQPGRNPAFIYSIKGAK